MRRAHGAGHRRPRVPPRRRCRQIAPSPLSARSCNEHLVVALRQVSLPRMPKADKLHDRVVLDWQARKVQVDAPPDEVRERGVFASRKGAQGAVLVRPEVDLEWLCWHGKTLIHYRQCSDKLHQMKGVERSSRRGPWGLDDSPRTVAASRPPHLQGPAQAGAARPRRAQGRACWRPQRLRLGLR